MSKKLIEDADSVFEKWKEAPSGSYLEGALAQIIARDLFPAVLELVKRSSPKAGFDKGDS